MAAENHYLAALDKFARYFLVQGLALRTHINKTRLFRKIFLFKQRLYRFEDRLGFHEHAGTAPEGLVVARPALVVREAPQVMRLEGHELPLYRALHDGVCDERVEHSRK